MAVGNSAKASGGSSVSVGNDSIGNGPSSVAIGNAATANDVRTTAIGNNAHAEGAGSLSIGREASALTLENATSTNPLVTGDDEKLDKKASWPSVMMPRQAVIIPSLSVLPPKPAIWRNPE